MTIRSPNSEVRTKTRRRIPPSRRRTARFGFQIFLILPLAVSAQITNDLPPLLPAYPELPPTFWEQHGVLVIVVGGLLTALVALGVWWLLRPKPPVVVPIEVQTRQELEALRQRSEDGRTLSRVSQILRRYVTGAFDLPPEELTTAEFYRAIRNHEKIGSELATSVSDFLRQCDERKFAPPRPRAEMGATDCALKLVERGEARRAHLVQRATAEAAVTPAPRA